MSGHTKGPWMWDSDPVKNDQTGRVRYRVVARGKTITQVYYSSYEGGPTNAEDDARLIAAAPDLYEAAQAVLARYESPSWNEHRTTAAAFIKLRDAIAKAEGQA